jgi:hypothetical protein
MKKKIGTFFAALLVIQMLGAGAVFADDVNVNINLLPDLIQPSDSTGTLTYEAQEGVHNTVTEQTGVAVNHFYFNFYVNGSKVLAVDPPAALY